MVKRTLSGKEQKGAEARIRLGLAINRKSNIFNVHHYKIIIIIIIARGIKLQ